MRADKVYQGDDDEVNLNLVPSPEGEGTKDIILIHNDRKNYLIQRTLCRNALAGKF